MGWEHVFGYLLNEGAKQGAYNRGFRHAMEGKPRRQFKPTNKDAYDKGYNDGLQQKLINAVQKNQK